MKRSVLALALITSACVASCDKKDAADPETVKTVADFTLPDSPQQAIEQSFRNQSQNSTRYTWNFGDGKTSQDENPTHIYQNPGTYSVKLKAFGAAKNDSLIKSVVVAPIKLLIPLAGVYKCKVIEHFTDKTTNITTKRRLSDVDITITQSNTPAVTWNSSPFPLEFHSISGTNTGGAAYLFTARVNIQYPKSARFYLKGDSAFFSETESGLGGPGRVVTYFYGQRKL